MSAPQMNKNVNRKLQTKRERERKEDAKGFNEFVHYALYMTNNECEKIEAFALLRHLEKSVFEESCLSRSMTKLWVT